MNLINLVKVSDYKYEVHFEKDNHIGDFIIDVDGYFYYWPGKDGCWQSYSMRWIADRLDEVNKEWDDKLKEYFKNEQQ